MDKNQNTPKESLKSKLSRKSIEKFIDDLPIPSILKSVLKFILITLGIKGLVGFFVGITIAFPIYMWLGLICITKEPPVETLKINVGKSKSIFKGEFRILVEEIYDQTPQRAYIKLFSDKNDYEILFKKSSTDTTLAINNKLYQLIFHNAIADTAILEVKEIN